MVAVYTAVEHVGADHLPHGWVSSASLIPVARVRSGAVLVTSTQVIVTLGMFMICLVATALVTVTGGRSLIDLVATPEVTVTSFRSVVGLIATAQLNMARVFSVICLVAAVHVTLFRLAQLTDKLSLWACPVLSLTGL